MDIGMNTKFKVTIIPKNDTAVYSQSLPMPIRLEEDWFVELALMHIYMIITVLRFSKIASPIFAQTKPNRRLRLRVDLRKINTLLAVDYTNKYHPVSNLSDTAQHPAGKSLFCKLDCSHAYHCLQMADQSSVEKLAFSFASGTFAYKRLAQGLNSSMSSFSGFMREYLNPIVKADECAQYVDDFGNVANIATDFTQNVWTVFQCNIESDNWKVSHWSQTSWIFRPNHSIRRDITTILQYSKFREQIEVPLNRKRLCSAI